MSKKLFKILNKLNHSRMQDDLSTMTRENQDVNLELEETMKSREDMKKVIQDKETLIHNLENNISSKVSISN